MTDVSSSCSLFFFVFLCFSLFCSLSLFISLSLSSSLSLPLFLPSWYLFLLIVPVHICSFCHKINFTCQLSSTELCLATALVLFPHHSASAAHQNGVRTIIIGLRNTIELPQLIYFNANCCQPRLRPESEMITATLALFACYVTMIDNIENIVISLYFSFSWQLQCNLPLKELFAYLVQSRGRKEEELKKSWREIKGKN